MKERTEQMHRRFGMYFDATDRIEESMDYDVLSEMYYDMGLKDDPGWPRCDVHFLTACHLYVTTHMENLEDNED